MSDETQAARMQDRLVWWARRPRALVQRLNPLEQRRLERLAREKAARVELLMRFESLGENCELAFVQEHLEAHPLGLFRWSGITLPHLIQALKTDLAGLGEPEHTTVVTHPVSREHFFRDLRYGMDTHTRMFAPATAEHEVMTLFGQRTRRLKEKLLEDIGEAEKTFVFQTATPPSRADVLRLHAALRRHGPSAELLVVHPAESADAIGRVERVEPGLMVGRIDRAGLDGVTWTISYPLWLKLLAEAARLRGIPVPDEATASLVGVDLPLAAGQAADLP